MHGNVPEPGHHGSPALGTSGTALRAGFAMSELSPDDLWMRCVAVGGTMTRDELEATLAGRRRSSNAEHDLIAQALNDYFTDRGQNHPVAYSHELDPSDASGEPH